MNTPNYHAACDRIGRLLTIYAREENSSTTEAFCGQRPSHDGLSRVVVSALKRMDFKPLLQPGLLPVLVEVVQPHDDLYGFRQLFTGLLAIIDSETD